MAGKKKNKLRVAFRKNRQKRVRQNDLTREMRAADEETFDQTAADERVSGRGALTRHRTIIGAEDESAGAAVLRQVDLDRCQSGRVVSAVGLTCQVQADDGRRYECAVRRVVRTMARDARNAVVTGDRVLFQPAGEGQGVIERVEPRRGVVARQSHGQEHILVANVDQVVIVVSAADPPLKPGLIDRFLISAEQGGVRSVVCINKVDLLDPAQLQPVAGVYGRLGYDVALTSGTTGRGIARLRTLLAGRESAFAGQSGVGKTSLLNALQPGLHLRTATVSDWTRKGRHTTRRAVLHPLDFGGWVVDTPGIRQFGLWDVRSEEVEGGFVEFRPFVTRCKFPDCTHTHEAGCGVKAAVERELISPIRYESYLKIRAAEPV